jgi:hypothetical protein
MRRRLFFGRLLGVLGAALFVRPARAAAKSGVPAGLIREYARLAEATHRAYVARNRGEFDDDEAFALWNARLRATDKLLAACDAAGCSLEEALRRYRG